MKHFFINRAILKDGDKFELIIVDKTSEDQGQMQNVGAFDTYEEAVAEGKRRCPPQDRP